ncbi:MAG TPA: bacterial transcriptional activator domain-containing protein [Candidatus Limnocylindria bacterium]|nr:bacterial transcriptional activator domain-containing protein [Candidatus Limnocylindria bacterium]
MDDSRLANPGANDPLAEVEQGTPQSGPNRSDLEALKDGAAMMIQAGNRVAAMALLWSAVAIDPTDLASHRRLAATLASGGDIDGAADEYARYIEFMLPLGEVGRATLELSYGASMLGGHPKLHEAAEKIVTSVRSIVPPSGVAIAPTAPAMRVPAPAMRVPAPPTRTLAPTAVASDREVAAPLRAPRLLPKVPFRFCVHADGDRHWMQLEGGTADLVPTAVRVVDANENIVETRLCIPLAAGDKGHAPVVEHHEPGVAWVVVGIPSDVVAAMDAGKPSRYGFQAKVDDEWLSLDLVDTGCRLGRTHAKSAAS